MTNESRAVSNLIQQVHARRLDTDPADLVLFERTNRAQPKRPVVPSNEASLFQPVEVVEAPPRKSLDAVLESLDGQPAPTPKQREAANPRVWPFMVATMLALALGI